MTRNRDFKSLVRERMTKTGERYSTARAHVLANRSPRELADGSDRRASTMFPSTVFPSTVFPSVVAVGGQQGDLAAARNLCTNAGVVGPGGDAMSEALAFGLAGGVGFLYGVFEYGDTPTMTIVARNQSMPDPFCQQLFDSLGIAIDVATTSGQKKAATNIDGVLATEQPALCTVGAGGLPYLGLPEDEAAMAPHLVGIVGTTEDGGLLIDDRSPTPIPVDRSAFDQARALYKPAKHRMVTVSADRVGDMTAIHWPKILANAVTGSADGFDRPPVPQFKSNVGLAGMTKWQELLTSSTKKGWGTVFGSDRQAAIGLTRLYDCINYAYTAPDAGRPLFAQFLTEAAAVLDEPKWAKTADLWMESGQQWRSISHTVLAAHPAIERYGLLSDQRAHVLDSGPSPAEMRMQDPDDDPVAISAEQADIIEAFQFSAQEAAAVFGRIAESVGNIVGLETDALRAIRG